MKIFLWKLILEFKNSFGKYHPVYPKTPKKIIKDLVKKKKDLYSFSFVNSFYVWKFIEKEKYVVSLLL